eukprot:CAMPEP_0201998456 /NCGR_PEP_ID=MMETSP0905-20130828/5247_1 /ASSEMBLY_ACC=CAM_ASM_000554 /TAXON_ID=420261 /ORGANISM="Thalassiosira antarctica, Strain CCMP982" /LENGTH=102 /DNA_ID=CAMNT_0048554439 /DNA_START=19 /DNA_END=324 /DNA_ORIENTATION=-
MSDENSLILAKLLQHVSSLTKLSLHSEVKKMGRNAAWHARHSDTVLSLQTEPDISMARHRLNSCSVEHVGFGDGKLVGCLVGRRGVGDGPIVGDFEGESDGV